MEIRLFGPVAVHAHGERVDIGGPTRQLVLAILASRDGRHAPIEVLIDQLWPTDSDGTAFIPKNPKQRMFEIIKDLRRAFRNSGLDGSAILVQERGGYCLRAERQWVDLHRFTDLSQNAMDKLAARDDAGAVKCFREAFRQWDPEGKPYQTQPFAGLSGDWVDMERTRLATAYRSGYIACADAEIRLGRHHRVLAELVEQCAADPLDEDLAALRMLALYGGGQPTEAQEVYQRLRKRIEAETGGKPGEKLRAVYQSIVRRDPQLSLASLGDPTPTSPREEKSMATNEFNNVVKGHGRAEYQIGQVNGDVYGSGTKPPSGWEDRANRLRKAMRTSLKQGVLTEGAAKAAELELDRALSRLGESDGPDFDEFISGMGAVKRLVDGADNLGRLADALIDEGLRGRP